MGVSERFTKGKLGVVEVGYGGDRGAISGNNRTYSMSELELVGDKGTAQESIQSTENTAVRSPGISVIENTKNTAMDQVLPEMTARNAEISATEKILVKEHTALNRKMAARNAGPSVTEKTALDRILPHEDMFYTSCDAQIFVDRSSATASSSTNHTVTAASGGHFVARLDQTLTANMFKRSNSNTTASSYDDNIAGLTTSSLSFQDGVISKTSQGLTIASSTSIPTPQDGRVISSESSHGLMTSCLSTQDGIAGISKSSHLKTMHNVPDFLLLSSENLYTQKSKNTANADPRHGFLEANKASRHHDHRVWDAGIIDHLNRHKDESSGRLYHQNFKNTNPGVWDAGIIDNLNRHKDESSGKLYQPNYTNFDNHPSYFNFDNDWNAGIHFDDVYMYENNCDMNNNALGIGGGGRQVGSLATGSYVSTGCVKDTATAKDKSGSLAKLIYPSTDCIQETATVKDKSGLLASHHSTGCIQDTALIDSQLKTTSNSLAKLSHPSAGCIEDTATAIDKSGLLASHPSAGCIQATATALIDCQPKEKSRTCVQTSNIDDRLDIEDYSPKPVNIESHFDMEHSIPKPVNFESHFDIEDYSPLPVSFERHFDIEHSLPKPVMKMKNMMNIFHEKNSHDHLREPVKVDGVVNIEEDLPKVVMFLKHMLNCNIFQVENSHKSVDESSATKQPLRLHENISDIIKRLCNVLGFCHTLHCEQTPPIGSTNDSSSSSSGSIGDESKSRSSNAERYTSLDTHVSTYELNANNNLPSSGDAVEAKHDVVGTGRPEGSRTSGVTGNLTLDKNGVLRHPNGEPYHHEEHHINQKVSNRHKIITSFIAGGLAGAIAKTTIAPLDRCKINFQTSEMRFSFKKALKFLSKTYKQEGFLALWRGNSATMVRIVPYAAIQFTAHEQYKLLLNKDRKRKHLPPALRAVAGSLAGITATSLTYPLDFARARMAVTAKERYGTILIVFRTVFKEEGWRVMMRGYTPTVTGSCIYSGISFFMYETLKIGHAEYSKGVDPSPFERWCFGAVAGICGQCTSYPLDIVRRRMQTAGVTGHSQDYTSIFRTARKVYTNEGLIGGLYKGLSMNWIKGPISAGISFMVFDTVQRWLRRWPVFHIEDD